MELSGASAKAVEHEGLMGRLPLMTDPGDGVVEATDIDTTLFATLVQGAVAQQDIIDRLIAERLAKGWSLPRLDAVVRAILRAGVTELLAIRETPKEIVINDFVDIAHMYFDGPEPGFVNATLDAVARARDAE